MKNLDEPELSHQAPPLISASSKDQVQWKLFPSTRYRGSKRKLVGWLAEQFGMLDFESCVDVFGGTGAVSYLLKSLGKQVVFNDHLLYNATAANAIISNDSHQLDIHLLKALIKQSPLSYDGTISNNYNSLYYKQDENAFLDGFLTTLIAAFNSSKLSKPEYEIALTALGQACLAKRPYNLFNRANLDLRTREIHRSFGNKTTWERTFPDLIEKFVVEINNSVFKGARRCRATNLDALSATNSVDLAYLDPPYLNQKRNTSDCSYLNNYHFLEGICNYGKWANNINFSRLNRPFEDDRPDSWSKINGCHQLHDQIIDRFRASIIVYSYRSPSTPAIATLTKKLKRHGRVARVISQKYAYALNRKSPGFYSEFLIISHP